MIPILPAGTIAQLEYCEHMDLPFFAPEDGFCPRCGNNIYDARTHLTDKYDPEFAGISVEEAGSRLITGCPHCSHSFCD